jgi:rare lipoprotein A
MLRQVKLCAKILLVLNLAILAGCSSMPKDGPPKFHVDVNRIPDAVPKVEPRSVHGNKSPYVVRGRRFRVLPSAKGYHAVGLASWYGTRFHNHQTSNRETYDMLAMTAAHRSLPLPTYVQVINLQNHRQVVVRVNDRGPFNYDRLIDLSYVAAKKLGMLGHGTTLVEVKAIDPEAMTIAAAHRSSHSRKPYVVYFEMGNFHHRANAKRYQHLLAVKLNYAVPIKIFSFAHPLYYQVKIGPLRDSRMIAKIYCRLNYLKIRNKKVNHAL